MEPCDKTKEIELIREDVREIRLDVKKLLQVTSVLRVKSSMWGALGGFIALLPIVIGLLVQLSKVQ